MKLEISIDDGNVSDLRFAKILEDYGLRGTFYYPSTQVRNTTLLSLKDVRENLVLKGHEIGGHTRNHFQDLKLIQPDEALFAEIYDNKNLIEAMLTKKPITKFCYPRGRHDQRVRDAVKRAGFTEARTTEVLKITNETGDPFQTPTTIHMFARAEYQGVHWLELAKVYYDKALELSKANPDVFFHLWGHSAELDRHNDWDNLIQFLDHVVKLSPVGLGASGDNGVT